MGEEESKKWNVIAMRGTALCRNGRGLKQNEIYCVYLKVSGFDEVVTCSPSNQTNGGSNSDAAKRAKKGEKSS